MGDRTVLRQSGAGVRRNVQVGEMPTNAMMVVLCGRKAASAKGPQMRATKKLKYVNSIHSTNLSTFLHQQHDDVD